MRAHKGTENLIICEGCGNVLSVDKKHLVCGCCTITDVHGITHHLCNDCFAYVIDKELITAHHDSECPASSVNF